jgi:myosin-1
VKGFLDKNKDLLFRDLSQAMFACDHPLLKKFFPEGDRENSSKKRPPTAGFQFRASIGELMKNLMSKHPNYIRCIKPNDKKQSLKFDTELVVHQVRYLGLMENLKVRRAGYAYRQFYEVVLDRYKMLASKTWPVWKGDPRDGLRELMKELKKKPTEYAFGRTKIFIRNPRTVFDLEDQRRAKLDDIAVLIQKMVRGWLAKTRVKY